MTSTTLLLYTGVFCFLIYSCVGDLPQEETRKQCEYDNIKKCNHEFKQVFMDAKAGQNRSKIGNTYCTALQAFMNCLDGSLGSCVGGSWLEEYSYVVLEHGMMDKKCRVCPNHDYYHLDRALNASSKKYYIGFDICFPYERRVHIGCVKRFLKKMETDTNICHDVQEFINCYKKAVAKKRPCFKFKIVKTFSNLCSQLGERMLKEDEKHLGLMC